MGELEPRQVRLQEERNALKKQIARLKDQLYYMQGYLKILDIYIKNSQIKP